MHRQKTGGFFIALLIADQCNKAFEFAFIVPKVYNIVIGPFTQRRTVCGSIPAVVIAFFTIQRSSRTVKYFDFIVRVHVNVFDFPAVIYAITIWR